MAPTLDRKSLAIGLAARIILAAAFLVAVWTISTQFKITTDLGIFLPPTTTSSAKILIKQLGKGATSKLLFVSISGADELELREVNKALAARLRSSELFARVLNGENDLNEADRDLIFKYRYLVTPLDVEQAFSVEGLHQALNERLRGLASSTATLEKTFLANDPVGATKQFIDLLLISEGNTGPLRIDNVWMSRDRERALMILEMRVEAFDIEGQDRAIRALREEFNTVNTGSLNILITGPGAFAVEARDNIRSDVRTLSVLAVVFVAAFLFLAFRSTIFFLLVMLPLTLGVIVAIGTVLLVFGSIHGVTLAFGVTLTGVAVDYPIHLVSQIPGRPTGARDHVKKIWPTLRLGVVTTIIAYASLIFSDFRGLTQLGVFTVAGLLTAAAVTRWLLPHVIPKRVATSHGMARIHNRLERAGRWAPHTRIWMILLVILAGAYLVLLDRPLRDDQLDSLSPVPADKRAQDRSLRRDLGMWSGAKLMAIIAPDAESALRTTEELMPVLDEYVEQGTLTDYDAASQYLPSKHLQSRRQSSLPPTPELRQRMSSALEGLPFKSDVFEPFISDIDQMRQLEPATLDTLGGTNLVPLLSPLLFELDGKWVAPILLHGVTDVDRLAALSEKKGEVEIDYLDLKQASNDVMQDALSHVLRLLAWGALLIYLVLVLSFRDVRKPVYILLPIFAAVVVATAILVAFGIKLTIFHLVSLLLIVGLGLDYSLFFSRLADSDDEWETTFKALWVCCVTTTLVFGMLLLSHIPPLQALGLTVSIGAGLCLVFGAVWSSAPPAAKKQAA